MSHPRKYEQLSSFLKERIIEEITAIGYQPTQVVQNLKRRGYEVSKKTVCRYYWRNKSNGSLERKPGSGRPKKLSPVILAAVQSEMAKSDEKTAKELHQTIAAPLNLEIHARTLMRGRKLIGYDCKSTQYCQFVSQKNQLIREQWAKEQLEAIKNGYRFEDIIFTDETKIILNSHRPKCCRRKGDPPNYKGTHKHPGTYFIWAGISARGTTDFLLFGGIMDSDFYVKEIIENTLLPSAARLYGNDPWKFQQDNGIVLL